MSLKWIDLWKFDFCFDLKKLGETNKLLCLWNFETFKNSGFPNLICDISINFNTNIF